MKQYCCFCLVLILFHIVSHAQKSNEQHLFSATQCVRYVEILKQLSEKAESDFKQHQKYGLFEHHAGKSPVSSKQEHIHSATLKNPFDRHSSASYTVRVAVYKKLLFSDGRYKPGIELELSGLESKQSTLWDKATKKFRHHITENQADKSHDEVSDMIQHFIIAGKTIGEKKRLVVKLDECTECEVFKQCANLAVSTVVCRRTMSPDILRDMPDLQQRDTVIFEPGIKNYTYESVGAFDYKQRLAELFAQHPQDFDGLLTTILEQGQDNHAWNFYFMEKNITGEIIKQICSHYSWYAPEYVAARLGLPAGIAWAQEYVQENSRAAQKLAKVFLHKTSEPSVDAKLLKNIIAILHKVCDKDLVSQGLMNAIAAKNLPLINMLLHHGADVNFIVPGPAFSVATPLEKAISQRDTEIVELLVQNGAKVETQITAIALAKTLVVALIEIGRMEKKSREDTHNEEKNLELIELLLRAGLRDTTNLLHNSLELCNPKRMSSQAKVCYERIRTQIEQRGK